MTAIGASHRNDARWLEAIEQPAGSCGAVCAGGLGGGGGGGGVCGGGGGCGVGGSTQTWISLQVVRSSRHVPSLSHGPTTCIVWSAGYAHPCRPRQQWF